jgi:hypothetical protein
MVWKSLLGGFLGLLGIGGKNGRDLGKETIEWLYHEQLKVDPEWSVWTEKGFRWWADKNAQTIEVIGEETGPDGDAGYLVSVRTEFLRDLDLNDESLVNINNYLMHASAMSGPVYDAESRTLSLCSLVRIYRHICDWMKPLISVAATMQIFEARTMGAAMAELLNAKEHISGHPEHGIRPEPDEMAFVVESLFATFGRMPCRWPESEFQNVVKRYMQKPPAYGAKSDGQLFSVAFPFGDERSRSEVSEDWHPWYGNGILLQQDFPVTGPDGGLTDAQGVRLALFQNRTELGEIPWGYGLGGYYYSDNRFVFRCFLPNVVYRPGFLPNLYFSSAFRAQQMALLLTGKDWD